jgi:hypothetical protein
MGRSTSKINRVTQHEHNKLGWQRVQRRQLGWHFGAAGPCKEACGACMGRDIMLGTKNRLSAGSVRSGVSLGGILALQGPVRKPATQTWRAT